MLTFSGHVEVYIAVRPTDMRKSFDSLAALVNGIIGQDALSGHLFVFFNKARDKVKVLSWERTGYCLWYKRLEQGTFHIPYHLTAQAESVKLDVGEFTLILEGLDLSGAHRHKRFRLRASDPVSG